MRTFLSLPQVPNEPAQVLDYLRELNRILERDLIFDQFPRGILRYENVRPEVYPIGTVDGVNQIFTVPCRIASDANDKPMAPLFWKTGFMVWVPSTEEPGTAQWRIETPRTNPAASITAETTTIKVGEPPWPGDHFVFPLVVAY